MKIGIFLEGSPKMGGGFFQSLKSLLLLLNIDKYNSKIEVIITDNQTTKYLKEKNIKSKLYKLNIFFRYFTQFFEIDLIRDLFNKFKISHPFTSFIRKNNYDLIIFLGPSILSKYCAEISFVSNIWDVDHKKNSPFPEHKKDYIYEKRENYLKIVLFKSFKIIVPHEENKNELIKFYNIPASKITIQTFIPYLPNMDISINKSEKVEENYDLEKIQKKKIILYPATFWAHKNHNFIIEAAKVMVKDNKNDFHFVMTGSDRGNFSHILKLINSENLQNYITIFPLISNFLLKKLYEDCFAVIMPTDAGPTNLPLYEAMFFKKPIFYSDKMNNDQELKKIIFSIDLSDVHSFLEKLYNINNDDIKTKTMKGYDYYNKFCTKESLYSNYKLIIDEFIKQYSKWN